MANSPVGVSRGGGVATPVVRRLALLLVVTSIAGCRASASANAVGPQGLPLPVPLMLGQQVSVYPLTLVMSDLSLGWADSLVPRREALDKADSIINAALTQRSPEVEWIPPAALRRAASRAPGLLSEPDRIGTAVLRSPSLNRLPDLLASQMRNLSGVAGGRLALVPASLVFTKDEVGMGRAELTLVLVDIRTGFVRWRNRAVGSGTGPWTALWTALETLTPGLP